MKRRTFSYTCCHTTAGGKSFVDSIRPLFPAARWGAERILVEEIKTLNLFMVPSWSAADHPADELIAYCGEAAKKGTIAVLMFHGIRGEYISIDNETHRKVIAYLDANRDKFWTDTFLKVADYIIKERNRLGWKN